MRKIFLTIVGICLAVSAFAADAQTGLIFTIDDFSGGLDNKTSEFKLPLNKATVLENLRLNNPYKSISRRTNLRVYGTADPTEPITGLFRHYLFNGDRVLLAFHGNELEKGADTSGVFTNILDITTSSKRFQCVSWHNIAICSDGTNQPIKYDG